MKSKVGKVAIATPEWHHYCPNDNCERSNCSRIQNFDTEILNIRKTVCPDCGEVYKVKNDYSNHSGQPKISRII